MSKITTKWIEDLAVTEGKIANNAVTTIKINNTAVDKTKLNADVAGNGITGGAGNALTVSPDTTGGANLAKSISVTGNGVAIKVDDTTIEGNVSNQLAIKAGGVGPTQMALGGSYAWTGIQNFTGATITVPLTPASDSSPTSKQYVDNVAQGLDVKKSCVASTTGTLPAYTYANGTAGVGATLTANASGVLPNQDNVTLVLHDRLLVKDETGGNAPYNGIYQLEQVGDGSNPWILKRVTDMDSALKYAGAFTFIEEGDTLADTGWVCTANEPITVGGTNITFSQFSGAGTYTASNGVKKTGNDFSLDINSLTNTETTPADGDLIALHDLTDNRTEKITWANLKAGFSTERTYQESFKIAAGDKTNGYITLTNTPISKRCIQVFAHKGANQFNKEIVGSTGATPDFDMADWATNPKNLYFRNVSPATGLSEDIDTDDIIIVVYHY